jgi:hypothetical protein
VQASLKLPLPEHKCRTSPIMFAHFGKCFSNSASGVSGANGFSGASAFFGKPLNALIWLNFSFLYTTPCGISGLNT